MKVSKKIFEIIIIIIMVVTVDFINSIFIFYVGMWSNDRDLFEVFSQDTGSRNSKNT